MGTVAQTEVTAVTALEAVAAAEALTEAAVTEELTAAEAVSAGMGLVVLPETAAPTVAEEVPLARTLAGLAGHLEETADTQT